MTHSICATLVTSLRNLSDEVLDGLACEGVPFFGTPWFRMVDSLQLGRYFGADTTLRWVVARCGDRVVGVLPVVDVRGPRSWFTYSFERYYFTGWQDELRRLAPEHGRWIPVLGAIVQSWRRFAQSIGASSTEWLLAVGPMSYRSGIALAPGADRLAVIGTIVDALQAEATTRQCPVGFHCVEARATELGTELSRHEFHRVFAFYDNAMTLPEGEVDGFLSCLRSMARRNVRRERAAAKRAGIIFETHRQFEGLAEELACLYQTTTHRYEPEIVPAPAPVWRLMSEHPDTEVIVARHRGRILGFTLMVHGKESWALRMGRVYDEPAGSALYFNLCLYEPLRRAAERGTRTLWLGPNGWEAKHHRGAQGHPLFNYIWFPSRRSTALLLPMVRLNERVAREQLRRYQNSGAAVRADRPLPVVETRLRGRLGNETHVNGDAARG